VTGWVQWRQGKSKVGEEVYFLRGMGGKISEKTLLESYSESEKVVAAEVLNYRGHSCHQLGGRGGKGEIGLCSPEKEREAGAWRKVVTGGGESRECCEK